MIVILLMMIVLLVGIIYYQYHSIKKKNKDLTYIQEKLNQLINSNTSEKLLVFTDDPCVRSVLIEINDLLEYNQKLSATYIRTENSMKKMLSNISHDLKTPLTVILGYIETLKMDTTLSIKEKELLLSKVQDKTMELLDLINKFFNLAKLESGDKVIPIARVHMNEVCRKSILAFYNVITHKGFQVAINIPDHNIYALGNEEALDRILNNLLSNAIKYGYEGQVIGLDLRADEDFVYVNVWDRGKGIKDINKERVFERLYTLEDSRNKTYQGSGLGLTITKRLVEKMEGDITLKSSPYEKTVFSFKLKRID